MKKIIIILSALFFLSAVIVFGIGILFYLDLSQPVQNQSKYFYVKPGDNWIKVLSRMQSEGVIDSNRFARYYVNLHQHFFRPIPLSMGKYEIKEKMNLFALMSSISNHEVILTKVVIPEGNNIYQVAKILEDSGLTTSQDFLTKVTDPQFVKKFDIQADTLEGYLYPDGYLFSDMDSLETIIAKFVHRYKDVFDKQIRPNLAKTNLNERQIQILASVVEKETGASFERPLIASVFLNRLKKSMRLQSDPTTIYGLLPNFSGNLKKSDLLEENPYNTYAIKALPKGPICNPGIQALQAVLEPEKSNYLYFVSKNDGTHVFSETLEQHNQAVEHYQRNPVNRQGKSWRDLNQSGK